MILSTSLCGVVTEVGQGAEFAEDGQPATNTAVQYRRVAEEHEIAREQGLGFLVEHGKITVAVRGRPRAQDQGA